jgi:hypothetical protein
MQTLFFRLLARDDKEATLRSAIATANRGELAAHVFHVDPSSFRQVPGSPFAYWVSERVRSVFRSLPAFQSGERRLRLGDHPSDDFRYLRLWWEVRPAQPNREWVTYYKGGSNFPYYGETALVVSRCQRQGADHRSAARR